MIAKFGSVKEKIIKFKNQKKKTVKSSQPFCCEE